MKSFSYVITDPDGIHARPAGQLVKTAEKFQSKITIEKDGKEADAKRIFGIMGLAAKKGHEIIIKADGSDEDEAIEELKSFLIENM